MVKLVSIFLLFSTTLFSTLSNFAASARRNFCQNFKSKKKKKGKNHQHSFTLFLLISFIIIICFNIRRKHNCVTLIFFYVLVIGIVSFVDTMSHNLLYFITFVFFPLFFFCSCFNFSEQLKKKYLAVLLNFFYIICWHFLETGTSE